MQIFITTVDAKIITLTIEGHNTIYDIKKKVENKENIPIKQQRLFFTGKLLADSETLLDCNINEESTLNLVLRLRVIVE